MCSYNVHLCRFCEFLNPDILADSDARYLPGNSLSDISSEEKSSLALLGDNPKKANNRESFPGQENRSQMRRF